MSIYGSNEHEEMVKEILGVLKPEYLAIANKIPNLSGFATKLTFPKAPKGTKIKIAKSAGDSCKVSGRVVKVKASETCDLTVTLSRKGKVVGSQTLLIGRS